MAINIPDIALPKESPKPQASSGVVIPDIKLPDIKLPVDKTAAAPADQPEGSWADVIGSALTSLPDRLQRSWQGIKQGVAVKAAGISSGVKASDATSMIDASKQGIESATAKLAALGYAPNDFDVADDASWDQKRERNEKFRGLVDKLSLEQLNADPDYVAARDEGLRLSGEIAANTPHTKDWSAKDLVSQVLSGASDMGPALLAGVVTRSPAVALGTMTPQAYGSYYQDSLSKGLNPLQADRRATVFAALEPLTEALPVGLIMRKGAGRLTDLGLSAVAEGGQEAVTQAIQNGYDIGALDEKMTLGQFLSDVAKSGVVGAGAGGLVHGVVHAGDMVRGNTPESAGPTVADEVRGAAQQPQATAVPEGEYDAVAAEMGSPAPVPGINIPSSPVAVSPERYAQYKAARDAGAAPQDALDGMQRDVQDAAANVAGGDALDSLVQGTVQPRDASSALRYGLPEMQIPAYLRQQPDEVGAAINQAGAPAPLDLVQQQVASGDLGLSPQELPQNLLPAPGQASVIALPGEVAAPVADQPQRPRFTMRDNTDERSPSLGARPAITIPEIRLPGESVAPASQTANVVMNARDIPMPEATVAPQPDVTGIRLPEATPDSVQLPNGQTVTARPDADVPGSVVLTTDQGRTVNLPTERWQQLKDGDESMVSRTVAATNKIAADLNIPDIKLPDAPVTAAEPVSNVRLPKQNDETFDVGDQFQLNKKVGGLDTDMPYTVRERYGDALVLEGADKVPRTITETQLRRAMVKKGLPVQEEQATAETDQATPSEVTPPKSMAARKTRQPRQSMAERNRAAFAAEGGYSSLTSVPSETVSTHLVGKGGSPVSVTLDKPLAQFPDTESVNQAVRDKYGYGLPNGSPMYEMHREAIRKVKDSDSDTAMSALFHYKGLIREDLTPNEMDLASDEAIDAARSLAEEGTTDFHRAFVESYRKFTPSVKKETTTAGMKPEALVKAYEDWSKGLKGLENVRVSIVPSQADVFGLPEGAPAMMAIYDPAGVHMVAIAENINTPEEAHAQFRHELVAHYGLRARLSKPEYDRQMDRILAAEGKDKRLDQYFKEVRENYADIYDMDSPDGQRMIAEEVVASVAENAEAAQRIGVVRQVIEAIRKMLVKSGILNDRATFNDVVDLVKANTDFIRQNYVDNDDVRRSIAPMRFQAPESYAPSLRKDRRVEDAAVPDHIKDGMRKVLHTEEGALTDTIQSVMDKNSRRDAGRWLYRKVLDDLDPIANLEKEANGGQLRQGAQSAYKMASNSRQANSIIASAMTNGVPTWQNGAVVTKKNSKGLLDIFNPIAKMKGNQLALWEYWAGAVRGKRLMAEGRENLYTQQEIDDVIAYVNSKPELRKAFNTAHKEYQEFKKDLLDFAEEAGTIDPAARALWDKDDYVPLYRVADDADKATAPGGKSRSFVNQSSGIKTLKGGTGKVDIMNNIFQNASHLITSSYNNRVGQLITEIADGVAMQEVPAQFKPVDVQNGEMKKALNELGVSTAGLTGDLAKEYSKLFQLAPPAGKDIVSVMFEGKRKYYQVTDPALMDAINQVGPRAVQTWMKLFSIPKQLLTRTVTSTPDFVIRNITRDILGNFVQQTSMAGRQGVGQILADSLTLRPIRKALQGAYKTLGDSEQVRAYRAAGGFSGGYDNARPDALTKEIRSLTTRTKVGNVPRKAWQGYEHFLNAGEMGTRMAVFDDVMKKTGDITEATFQANDVLNFSRRGSGVITNFLMNSVPFMNARVQGLDRLARGAGDNFGAFVLKGAMISAATMALMAMNKDDERYWAMNEAVRDNYWIIPVDNGFVQIPKPFEVGSLFGTVLERAYEAASRDDKVFWDRMLQMFASTFAMNPTPQALSPIVQDLMNKDFFMDRPIVSEGMKFKDAPDQFDSYTPEFIKSLGKSLPESFPDALRSPVRLQHLLEGYTGSMGQYVMSAADSLYRDGMGMPDRPARADNDVPGLNIFLKPDNKSSKYITRVYEMQEEVRKANAKLKDYREARDRDGVMRTKTDKADELAARKSVEKASKKLTDLSKESRKIMEDGELTAAEKRVRMDAITVRKNEVAKDINDRWWKTLNK